MSGKLIFPRAALAPSKLLSATNQAGRTFFGMVPAVSNVGGLTFTPAGVPTSDLTLRLKIATSGNLRTAEYLASIDLGVNWLGRKYDTTWDGNGATSRTVLDDSTNFYCSRPVEIDRDGDGVPDRVLVAVMRVSTTPDRIDILYTDDMTGAGAWSSLATDVTGDDPAACAPALLFKDGSLYLLSDQGGVPYIQRSTDFGVTWGANLAIDTICEAYGKDLDLVLLASGKLLAVYLKTISSYVHVVCKSSIDGTTWTSSARQVTTGSVNFLSPTAVQDLAGKTVIFFRRDTATQAIQARQNTATDPAASGWASYSETLFAGDTNDGQPSAVVAPDGTIYVVVAHLSGTGLVFSKFKAGDANYSAVAAVTANARLYPAIGVVGGALWCLNGDYSGYNLELLITKYWTAYNSTTAPASWTGTGQQYISSGVWVLPGGSGASGDDTYDMTTRYNYSAGRMLALRPRQPARSTGDGAAWNAVFDLTANVLIPIDTICAMGNVDHFHFQMNDSDSWGSPSVNTTVSFARETIASGGYSVVAGKATRSAGAWVAGTLAGSRVRFGTLAAGTAYVIADNDETHLYIEADISGVSGDMVIYSPRAWATQTLAAYRYLRILIDAQETAEGYYEIPVVLLGAASALADEHRAQIDWSSPVIDGYTRGHSVTRQCPGEPWREYRLSLAGPELDMSRSLIAKFNALGASPLAFIPDATDAFDWALCLPDSRIRWSPFKTEIVLVETD